MRLTIRNFFPNLLGRYEFLNDVHSRVHEVRPDFEYTLGQKSDINETVMIFFFDLILYVSNNCYLSLILLCHDL